MADKNDPFQIAGVNWQRWTCTTVDPEHRVALIKFTRYIAFGLVPSESPLCAAIERSRGDLALPIQLGPKCPGEDGSIQDDAPKGMSALVIRGNSLLDIHNALIKLREFLTLRFPELQDLFFPTSDEGLAVQAH